MQTVQYWEKYAALEGVTVARHDLADDFAGLKMEFADRGGLHVSQGNALLSETEDAEALSISVATLKRDWNFALACRTARFRVQYGTS
jgi:hypothetical protein